MLFLLLLLLLLLLFEMCILFICRDVIVLMLSWGKHTTACSSLGCALGCYTGSHEFETWPDQHSGSLNNWGESAAFVISSANGQTFLSSQIRTLSQRSREPIQSTIFTQERSFNYTWAEYYLQQNTYLLAVICRSGGELSAIEKEEKIHRMIIILLLLLLCIYMLSMVCKVVCLRCSATEFNYFNMLCTTM